MDRRRVLALAPAAGLGALLAPRLAGAQSVSAFEDAARRMAEVAAAAMAGEFGPAPRQAEVIAWYEKRFYLTLKEMREPHLSETVHEAVMALISGGRWHDLRWTTAERRTELCLGLATHVARCGDAVVRARCRQHLGRAVWCGPWT